MKLSLGKEPRRRRRFRGRIITLRHLVKQRGGHRAWDTGGELSSVWTGTKKRVWKRRDVASIRLGVKI